MTSLPEIIGLIGVCITLIAYFLLSIRKMKLEKIGYPAFNALGSIMILYSLYYDRNLAATVMEVCWLSISLYGALKALQHRSHYSRKKEL